MYTNTQDVPNLRMGNKRINTVVNNGIPQDIKVPKRKGKKKKKGNKVKKTIIFCVILLAILLSMLGIIYYVVNDNIYRQIVACREGDTVPISYSFDYILLWDKTIQYLKDNEKDLIIERNDRAVRFACQEIPKLMKLDLCVSDEKLQQEELLGLAATIVHLNDLFYNAAVNQVIATVPAEVARNGWVDIYMFQQDGSLAIYQQKVAVEDSKVKIDLEKDKKSDTFVIVYVPVTAITLDKQDILMNKKSVSSIQATIVPQNATNKTIVYSSQPEGVLEVNTNGEIRASTNGEADITVGVENEEITSIVHVTIQQTVETIKLSKTKVTIQQGNSTNVVATVSPLGAVNKELLWTSSNEEIAKVETGGKIIAVAPGNCQITIKTEKEPTVTANINVTVTAKTVSNPPSGNVIANNGPKYINGILLVNKVYGLPSNYNPGTSPVALAAFNTMKKEAAKDGITLWIASGFRTYAAQVRLYNNYVKQYGQAAADTFSAKPGYSEHQTGLTFDVNIIDDSFANTKEAKWIASNCHKYGFIVRFPKGKEAITGYKYEPWHLRYIGNPAATNVYTSGKTLEEFLGAI